MGDLKLLVWLTQLGLSVAVEPILMIGLALWLHNACHWGSWVIWVGIILGLVLAIDGFRRCMKAMEHHCRFQKKDTPPVSFNEHD